MKKFLQKRLLSVFISIFVVLATCCGFFSNKVVSASAEQDKWTYSDCEEVISFIENNFSRFVLEYNKTVGEDEKLTAVGIEHTKIIWLVEDNNHGCYIDFIGNKGYVVVTGDYNIYDIQVVGDYPELRTVQKVLYSSIEGLVCFDKDGEIVKFKDTIETVISNEKILGASSAPYTGQTRAGDGYIYDIHAYVSDRYPDYVGSTGGYTAVETLNSNFEHVKQTNTSYYCKYKIDENGVVNNNKLVSSEGNCVLNSLYSCMLSWYANDYIEYLPDSYITLNMANDITNDPLYSTWGTGTLIREEVDQNGQVYNSAWAVSNETGIYAIPRLYKEIRDYAVQNCGYVPEGGLQASLIMDIGEYIANNVYENSIQIYQHFMVEDSFANLGNRAAFLSINGSSSYEHHAVVLIGYRHYAYTSGWWIFSETHNLYFYQISDGHNYAAQYFDPNTSANPTCTAYYISNKGGQ